MKETAKNMLEFIDKSPSPYHAVKNIADSLEKAGFTRLQEGKRWEICEGGKYYVIKNSSSIIAFEKGSDASPFMICASHSDSPSFKIKEEEKGVYVRLSTEKYGGMILYSWFDRPLSIAGRVVVKTENGVAERLLNIDRDLLVIPSVAIHMQRNANEGFSPNPAVDLLPLLSLDKSVTLKGLLSAELSVAEEDILAHDLYLYTRQKGSFFGANEELIVSPRLDDLECAYTSLSAFIDSKSTGATKVLAVFDNEEVGSETKQGAASTFLSDVLERISPDRESYLASLESSFMVSADNAHAKHPAHPEFSDSAFAPLLSGGVVIKYNANQRYTTDAISSAVFEKICKNSDVKVQYFRNRADKLGGSTLGSISTTKVSVSTNDIGIAQLAMHSAVETASVSDVLEMKKALTAFYGARLEKNAEEIVIK